MVHNEMYDLVLMDIQMPEMDGLEATRHIRNMQDTKKASIPIVALTANLLKGDGDQYLAAGMNGFLSKPFDDQKLFNIIALNLENGSMPVEALKVADAAPASSLPSEKLYDLSMVQAIAGGDAGFIKKNGADIFRHYAAIGGAVGKRIAGTELGCIEQAGA